MSWIGRIIGLVIGWKMGGIFGALAGFVVGMLFDRGRAKFRAQADPVQRQRIEQSLFRTVFPLMGHIAKADGRVSEQEVQAAEVLMARMQLSDATRKEAINLFKEGTKAEYNLASAMRSFMEVCGPYGEIKQLVLAYLVSMALADGDLHAVEVNILKQVAGHLGYSEIAFEHFIRMARAQAHFHRDGSGQAQASTAQDLDCAYEALGVEKTATDADIKRAYRKLMSQYHPDKLMGQGVPEEMVKVATERVKEVQAAYDLIKKSRAT